MKVLPPKNKSLNRIYVMPRRSGKTARAIQHFMKDPENSILIVENQGEVRRINRILHDDYLLNKRIFSKNQNLIGFKFKNLIIDDLEKYNDKLFYDLLPRLKEDGNVVIYTTSLDWNSYFIEYNDFRIIDNIKPILRHQINILKYIKGQNIINEQSLELEKHIKNQYMQLMKTQNISIPYLLQ